MKKNNHIKSSLFSAPLILTTGLTLSACEGIPIGKVDNSHEETLIVYGNKVECRLFNAANSTLCLHAKIKGDNNDKKFLLANDEIKNFSYDWGYDYELEVDVEDLTPPPEDAPSKKYTLVKQNKKETTPTIDNEFEISISSAPTQNYIKKVSGKDNTYKIFDDKEIECLTSVCAELDQLITDDKAILLELNHQSPVTKPLELIKISCNAPQNTFVKNCLEK